MIDWKMILISASVSNWTRMISDSTLWWFESEKRKYDFLLELQQPSTLKPSRSRLENWISEEKKEEQIR